MERSSSTKSYSAEQSTDESTTKTTVTSAPKKAYPKKAPTVSISAVKFDELAFSFVKGTQTTQVHIHKVDVLQPVSFPYCFFGTNIQTHENYGKSRNARLCWTQANKHGSEIASSVVSSYYVALANSFIDFMIETPQPAFLEKDALKVTTKDGTTIDYVDLKAALKTVKTSKASDEDKKAKKKEIQELIRSAMFAMIDLDSMYTFDTDNVMRKYMSLTKYPSSKPADLSEEDYNKRVLYGTYRRIVFLSDNFVRPDSHKMMQMQKTYVRKGKIEPKTGKSGYAYIYDDELGPITDLDKNLAGYMMVCEITPLYFYPGIKGGKIKLKEEISKLTLQYIAPMPEVLNKKTVSAEAVEANRDFDNFAVTSTKVQMGDDDGNSGAIIDGEYNFDEVDPSPARTSSLPKEEEVDDEEFSEG